MLPERLGGLWRGSMARSSRNCRELHPRLCRPAWACIGPLGQVLAGA